MALYTVHGARQVKLLPEGALWIAFWRCLSFSID